MNKARQPCPWSGYISAEGQRVLLAHVLGSGTRALAKQGHAARGGTREIQKLSRLGLSAYILVYYGLDIEPT